MFWKRKKRTKALIVTEENFLGTIASGRTLIMFGAPWCGACKMIKPVVHDVAHMFEDDSELTVGIVDTDQNQNLSRQFNIRSLPTFILFDEAQVLHMQPGIIHKGAMIDLLQNKKPE